MNGLRFLQRFTCTCQFAKKKCPKSNHKKCLLTFYLDQNYKWQSHTTERQACVGEILTNRAFSNTTKRVPSWGPINVLVTKKMIDICTKLISQWCYAIIQVTSSRLLSSWIVSVWKLCITPVWKRFLFAKSEC